MAQTVGLETLESQLLDSGGTVPFPFSVPQPVPISKNDRTDNPTPQALTESEKTSVKSGGLEGEILRRSLNPKARMQPQTTVPQTKELARPQKPTGGGLEPSGTTTTKLGTEKVSFDSAEIKHQVSDRNRPFDPGGQVDLLVRPNGFKPERPK